MTKASRTVLYALIEAGQQAHRVVLRPLVARGLEPGDDALLMLLGSAGATEAGIADALEADVADLRSRLARLVARDLIAESAVGPALLPGYALTDRGVRFADQIAALWVETELALTGNLKKKERRELAELLSGFAEYLRRGVHK